MKNETNVESVAPKKKEKIAGKLFLGSVACVFLSIIFPFLAILATPLFIASIIFAIKEFIQRERCAECGAKTNGLTRVELQDGNCLCGKCAHGIPYYLHDCFRWSYTYEDYLTYREYVKKTHEQLPEFNTTRQYGELRLDETCAAFCIDYVITDDTMFYPMSQMERFELTLKEKDVSSGVFNDTLTCDAQLEAKMEVPPVYFTATVKRDIKIKVRKNGEYELPEDYADFLANFYQLWQIVRETECEEVAVDSELQKAMALFMIDDLEKITLDELKKIRNRLIKTFHPDADETSDTGYSQKINDAYEILKSVLKEGE